MGAFERKGGNDLGTRGGEVSGGIELRMPYNSDPIAREKINYGKMEYFDFHLGSVAQYVKCGFFGEIDLAMQQTLVCKARRAALQRVQLGRDVERQADGHDDAADAVVVITDHRAVDYARVVARAGLVVDTRNALGKVAPTALDQEVKLR